MDHSIYLYIVSAVLAQSTVWVCQCEFEVIMFVYWNAMCFAAELGSHSIIKPFKKDKLLTLSLEF